MNGGGEKNDQGNENGRLAGRRWTVDGRRTDGVTEGRRKYDVDAFPSKDSGERTSRGRSRLFGLTAMSPVLLSVLQRSFNHSLPGRVGKTILIHSRAALPLRLPAKKLLITPSKFGFLHRSILNFSPQKTLSFKRVLAKNSSPFCSQDSLRATGKGGRVISLGVTEGGLVHYSVAGL